MGFDIGQIDEDKLEKLIRKPWAADGYNFSERIWRDKNKLLNLTHQEITKSAMLGCSPDRAIKAIAQAMGTPVFTPYQHSNTKFNINACFIGNRHNLNHR